MSRRNSNRQWVLRICGILLAVVSSIKLIFLLKNQPSPSSRDYEVRVNEAIKQPSNPDKQHRTMRESASEGPLQDLPVPQHDDLIAWSLFEKTKIGMSPSLLTQLDYQDKDIDFKAVRKCFQAGDSKEKELALQSIILSDVAHPGMRKSRRREIFDLLANLIENDTPRDVLSNELKLPLRVAGMVSYSGVDLARLLVYLKYFKRKNVPVSDPLSKRLYIRECIKIQLQKMPKEDRKSVISDLAEVMDKDALDGIVRSLSE